VSLWQIKNMKKKYPSLIATIFVIGIVFWTFYSMMPQSIASSEKLTDFSTNRALKIVKTISAKPHFVGSDYHENVSNYLFNELKKLGLETTYEEGFTLTEWGNLTKSKNIIAKIKGSNSGKALLLLSHYDSAPHSFSQGASDDAVGIATILESVRAFLNSNVQHKNDIIILFTDAEELGLNGAALFVTKNKLCKEVGLAINFEARGTSGPSFMLMEVNKGNAKMVEGFANANPKFAASNSLMYSIYKMLPNDTDLTVFREHGNIQGFNFAFIDNHFNYHTQQDDVAHLDLNSLAHQGSYCMPILKYFASADLKSLNSTDDYVYFSSPIGFFYYSFSWVLASSIVALILFGFLIFLGIGKRVINLLDIAKGFLILIIVIGISGCVTYFGWNLLLKIYPQYNDLINGFTYNGHDYIAFFMLLTLSVCFLVYSKFVDSKNVNSYSVAAFFLWIIINFLIAFNLQGAGFLIIPLLSSLILFGIFIFTQKNYWLLQLIFAIPTLVIIVPFLQLFPVGLGLKIMFGSSILLVLIFGLLLPIFGSFSNKSRWSLMLFLVSILMFTKAHFNSNYEAGKAKPNSLLYVYDADSNKANWTTYDKNLDEFTKKYLGENPKPATSLNDFPLFSKYNSGFTFMNEAEIKGITGPNIEYLKDSVSGYFRFLKIKISPTRKVNRYDIFANEKMIFFNFKANGVQNIEQNGKQLNRNGKKILSYYVVDNVPLEIEFAINTKTVLDMNLMESSFDLMTNPEFNVEKRKSWMMPLQFVLNDAIVIKQHIIESINNDSELSDDFKKQKSQEKLLVKIDSIVN
jgi:Peptidase family M28